MRTTPLPSALATAALLLASCGPAPEGGRLSLARWALTTLGSGTNQPGAHQDFTVTITDADTTLLLEVLASGGTGSHLLVKRGAAPSTDTDFDWASRRDGQRNYVALERPELQSGTYHVRVLTPASAPAPHAFTLSAGKGEPVRTQLFPVSKPLAFDASGTLAAGVAQHFRVVLPPGHAGARAVAACGDCTVTLATDAGGGGTTAIPRSGAPATVFEPEGTAEGERFLQVAAGTVGPFTLHVEASFARTLAWDPGLSASGTTGADQPDTIGGDYLYRLAVQAPAAGAWRHALRVDGGEAHLSASHAPPVNGQAPEYLSERTGDDGYVLDEGAAAAGTAFWLVVRAAPGATWHLLAGDVFAHDLGPLAPWDGAACCTAVPVGPEGAAIFKTSVPAGADAWRLWATSANQNVAVRKTKVPVGANAERQAAGGQLLLVPPYLTSETYFVSVPGAPRSEVALDSRQQRIRTPSGEPGYAANGAQAEFSFSLDGSDDGGFGFVTYRVPVPVEQIAWQVSAEPRSGNPDVYLRRGFVPNVDENDALSEAAAGVVDSATVVPPSLSDGAWYVTVHGTGAFTFRLTSGVPVITGIPFVNDPATPAGGGSSGHAVVNDAPARAGWRYYQVSDIASQIGALGWELLLAGAPAGAEIAIRRNAVPGRWFSRHEGWNGTEEWSHSDAAITSGLLQRPAHQADIWYIGIHARDQALGAFELTTRRIASQEVAFNAGAAAVVAQPASEWRFFRVVVPDGALGWDARLANVTGGSPRLVVRRESLPEAFTIDGPSYGSVPGLAAWPTSYHWAPTHDWTNRWQDADGTSPGERRLVVGAGSPLVPGTYYVGVKGSTAQPLSYTFESRAIGTGNDANGAPWAIQVADLDFTDGVATVTALGPREAAYYRITVPTGASSWRLQVMPEGTGEAMLAVNRGSLPNSYASTGSTDDALWSNHSGVRRQKPGTEWFYKYPSGSTQDLAPGVFYAAVISEGNAPAAGATGAGSVTARLESLGPVPIEDRTATPVTAGAPVIWTGQTLAWGDERTYRVRVPDGVPALQVRLRRLAGSPGVSIRQDPAGGGRFIGEAGNQHYYATEGGDAWFGQIDGAHELWTVAAPAAGDYTLVVREDLTGRSDAAAEDMSYALEVEIIGPDPLAFNGGTSTVSNQLPGSWRFFQVTVPPGALGWDLRLRDVTAGSPRLVVRRDVPPDRFGQPSGAADPASGHDWPSGVWWTAQQAWGIPSTDGSGADAYGRAFVAAMGAPLEPGSYIVGVSGTSTTGELAYTIESRGIGQGNDAAALPWAIQVVDLPFTGGTETVSALAAREAAYYRVVVPEGAGSYGASVTPTSGDVMLASRPGFIPNSMQGGPSYTSIEYRSKTGAEYDYDYGPYDISTVAPGPRYLAVVAEGNGGSSATGLLPSAFTITSEGEVAVHDRTTTPVNPGDVLQWQAVPLPFGAHGRFRFRVPAGVSSLEIRVTGVNGQALGTAVYQATAGAARIPGPFGPGPAYSASAGGAYPQRSGTSLVTWSEPPAGDYTILVYAGWTAGGTAVDERVDVTVSTQGTTAVAFNGGRAPVAGQLANTWRYFRVEVPPDALGWSLRLRDVTEGEPRLLVRRDLQPDTTDQYAMGPLNTAGGTWPTGKTWIAQTSWSYRYASTWTELDRELVAGMGSPLEPGVYFVGVTGTSPALSYTLESRGIGTGADAAGTPWAIQVADLPFAGAATVTLEPREIAFFRVEVPAQTESWALDVEDLDGGSVLAVNHGALPNGGAEVGCLRSYNTDSPDCRCGRVRRTDGGEFFYKYPDPDATFITSGVYYVGVMGEGGPIIDPTHLGIGPATFTVTSRGTASIADRSAEPLGAAGLTWAGQTKAPGQERLYRFRVPAGVAALEVALANRTGALTMVLQGSPAGAGRIPSVWQDGPAPYSGEGGTSTNVRGGNAFLTWPAPTPGDYTLRVMGLAADSARFDVVVSALEAAPLNLDPVLSASGGTSVAAGSLADTQRRFYAVDVPATMTLPNGEPVAAWRLEVSASNGTPRLRLRRGALPDDTGAETLALQDATEQIITTPVLQPGRWYVEVLGVGLTDYTLASSVVRPERPTARETAPRTWVMPATANVVFGDTGVQPDGSPVVNPNTGDAGIDLARGRSHFYKLTVPAGNGGLLRTKLEALSGQTTLYLRAGAAPSISHGDALGSYHPAYDRRQWQTGTMYGNWVPLGAHDAPRELPPGDYWLMVRAEPASNARYRLVVSTGDVQPLALAGGAVTGQTLAAGDLRYYRVAIPAEPSASWSVTFSRSLGDAALFVREGVPPGFGEYPATGLTSMVDWRGEANLAGAPAPGYYDAPGTYAFGFPPLVPGATYYLGVLALTDSVFDLSSAVSGATLTFPELAFHGGTAGGTLAPGASLVYRIVAPAEARWFQLDGTWSAGTEVQLDEGRLPSAGTGIWAGWGTSGTVAAALTPGAWSWAPDRVYYLRLANPGAVAVTYSVSMRRPDADGDGHADPRYGGDDCDDTRADVYPGAPAICTSWVDADCSGTPDASELVCCPDADGDGHRAASCGGDDCDDADPNVHPGAAERCNGVDDDCDGVVPANERDADGDGYRVCSGDCNDANASIHPGATDVPGDGIDQDCSGADAACPDADGDGYPAAWCGGTDCNDADPSVHPGAADLCGDGIDQDCDGADARCACRDADGDGYPAASCGGTDCDDTNPAIHPNAREVCGDGVDQDCDGADLACTCADTDGDGYAAVACGGTDCDDTNPAVHPGAAEVCGNSVAETCTHPDVPCSCPDADGDGHRAASCGGTDCDDANPAIHPGAPEVCGDGIDQDCSGADLACACVDADGDGYLAASCGGNDCDDTNPAIHPSAREICGDGIDQDCSGADLACPACSDADGDGYPAASCGGTDCDDTNPAIHPSAREICGDGVDQDCSGADLACACPDADGDGYPAASCGGTDCDDTNPAVHPGATEVCANGVDDDCDGRTDAADPRCPPAPAPPPSGGSGGGGGCGEGSGGPAALLFAGAAVARLRRRARR